MGEGVGSCPSGFPSCLPASLRDDGRYAFGGVVGLDLLFPPPEGDELSNAAMGVLIDFMHEERINGGRRGYLDAVSGRIATQHGFRSTFRDWAAEVSHFPREIIEHASAHQLEDEAEAAYQRGDLLVKRATLMQAWALFCDESEFEAAETLGPLVREGAASAV